MYKLKMQSHHLELHLIVHLQQLGMRYIRIHQFVETHRNSLILDDHSYKDLFPQNKLFYLIQADHR